MNEKLQKRGKALSQTLKDKLEKIELKLALQERQYRLLAENCPDFIVRYDLNLRRTYVNPAWEKASGLSAMEVIDIPHTDIPKIPVSELDEYISKIHEALETGVPQNIEFEWENADGIKFFLSYRIVPEYDCNAKITGVLAIGRDLTEQMQSQAEIVKLRNQISQAQRMEVIGTLAGGIAHDFNNILFPIIGLSEMLMEDLPADSIEHESATEIWISAKRASELVKQILAFSRHAEQKKAAILIQPILKEVIKLTRATISKQIEIKQYIQKDCGLVFADPTKIYQIAMNLITNASQALEKDGGLINVTLKSEKISKKASGEKKDLAGNYVVLSVSDTGKGIVSCHLDKIFDPYFTTKKGGKGTGIGLCIVNEIVNDHGGKIYVSSSKSRGTTFEVYLPELESVSIKNESQNAITYKTGNEKILLIDDEIQIVRYQKRMLEKLGYVVEAMTDSTQALETFKTNPERFDLVITDMAMPGIDGEQLAKEMLTSRQNIPIILCTGFSQKIDHKKSDETRIKGFLLKPVSKLAISDLIRELLDNEK